MTIYSILLYFFIGCAIDRQAIKLDDQEKSLLMTSAQRHWEGRRWNIPERAAFFYEDPLVRARKEGSLKSEYRRLVEVAILHVELDPKDKVLPNAAPNAKQKSETNERQVGEDWLRTGTVWVRIEGIGRDNVLRVKEEKQDWYRTSNGWWLVVKKK